MFIRFRTNLGSVDAAALAEQTGQSVNAKDCTIGNEMQVKDAAGDWLVSKGIAEQVEKNVKGVAKQSELTAPSKS